MPRVSERQVLVEYTAHPDARFHLRRRRDDPGSPQVEQAQPGAADQPRRPGDTARHAAGRRARQHQAGGREAARARRRPANTWRRWTATASPTRPGSRTTASTSTISDAHPCTYIPGETTDRPAAGPGLPRGLQGLRDPPGAQGRRGHARHRTRSTIEIEKVLPWRERGWVTADTHVHFLSPDLGAARRRGRRRQRRQPAGQPVGRADDQRRRLRRQDHLGRARGRRRRRVPGARGHRKPPARAGPHLAAGLPRPASSRR